MTMPNTNPEDVGQSREKLLASVEDMRRWDAERFDAEVTQLLLSRYKIGGELRERLLEGHAEAFGVPRLSLEQFSRFFTDFPAYLVCRHIEGVAKDATLSRLFTDFARRKFVRAYADQEEILGGVLGRPLGLVFNWAWLRGARGLVLHNRHVLWSVPGVRIVWVSPDARTQLVVEPLPVFLDGLDAEQPGGRWRPRAE